MKKLLACVILLASAYQTALGTIYIGEAVVPVVEGDWTYVIAENKATITRYSGAAAVVTIPQILGGNSVTNIGVDAFWSCTSLTSITIPNSVTSIGSGAFSSCTSLTSITIPNSVTSIGGIAFSNCTSLTSIAIPNSVTSIEWSAFSSCTSLTSITIPNSVTSIGNYAFGDCTSLTSITIPNSVTSIGGNAFSNCTSLTSITIPNSVTGIGDWAFADCTSLTSVTMPDRFIPQIDRIGIRGQVATDYLVNALANNDAFVTAVANKIKATSGNYGISIKSELGNLATKSELTSSLAQSRTDGINSVLSNPNLWTLYTTSQIQNMAVEDLVLTRQVSGEFVLNYDIE